MNKILQKELEEGRFYHDVETSYRVSLSSSEKMALKEYLNNKNHSSWTDLFYDTMIYLKSLGYDSASIRKGTKKQKDACNHAAKAYLENFVNKTD